MNTTTKGIDARVIEYFHLVDKKHGFTSFFDGERGTKEKCKLFVNSQVRNELNYRVPEAKCDIKRLYELVRVKAREEAIEERALKKSSHSSCKYEKEYKPSSNLNKRNSGHHDHRTVKKVRRMQNTKQHQQNGDRPERSGAKGAPKEGCFHCGGPHYLSKCPTVTPAERDELLAEHKHDKKGGGTANLKRIRSCFPKQNRVVVLEDKVEVPVCIDSGTDRCCLDESCFERLRKAKPYIACVKLDEPLQCMMANCTSVRVDWTVKLNLRLQTIAGKSFIPVDSGEFLLGSDLLVKLGIDVERQMDLLAVLLAADVNDNEFDKDDEPVIGRTVIQEEDVRTGILELVELLIKDGFPREYAKELTRIALRFDLWRIRLGMDPPAKVSPMRIRLKPGAKPYRCKARKYPPEVRRFMDDFNNQLVELGWVYENRESRWACPALPVRKGNGEFDKRQITSQRMPL
ncbi:LOW QUALITY PROTEIN: Hypothetical protein PHPALM_20510 [Phytophthora palmivora]|uniref:Uncharacterized protein n=1 Tax=Phytophthora palmivora TaxID=4796 RepID=A0A2P4XEQ2_9STRA|nr:LOW QUALITY PROTEIN: Hypothetical protein PHPALM_20510 [Phytophthora palmivora]